jgi:hypothetical protein
MKNLVFIIFIFFGVMVFQPTSFSVLAQENQPELVTDSIYVHGVCNMCKDRIENAAFIKGVKKARWNKKTHYLVVVYKPEKISLEAIEKEVAKVGHDTEHFTADDKVYNSLPECCAYRSGTVDPH